VLVARFLLPLLLLLLLLLLLPPPPPPPLPPLAPLPLAPYIASHQRLLSVGDSVSSRIVSSSR
jgi:hypothetical protein